MKKGYTLLVAMLLVCVLCVPAFAVSGMSDVDTNVITNLKTADGNAAQPNGYTWENAERFTVTASGTENGKENVIWVVAGSEAPAEDTIYYVDQKTATGDTISFDVFPKKMPSGTYSVYVTNDASSLNTAMPLTTFTYTGSGPELEVTLNGASPVLTWSLQDGAAYYLVVRVSDGVAEYASDWLSGMTTTFTDATAVAGKTYAYYVMCYVGDDWSVTSNTVENVVIPGGAAVAPVLSETVTFDAGKPVLTWSGAYGIDNLLVVRVGAGGSEYVSDWLPGTATTFTDTSAVPGAIYHYYLSCNVGGDWSLSSNAVYNVTIPGGGPTAPTLSSTITFDAGKPVLTWYGASGIDYLLMIRVNASTGVSEFVSDWMYGTDTTFTDTNAVPGQIYHYYLWCNVGGEWDLTSNAVYDVVIPSAEPTVPMLSDTVAFDEGKPVLTWSGASGIDYLLVVRVGAGGTEYVSDWLPGTATTFTDTSAVPGATYHYYLSCNVGGEWSLSSNAVYNVSVPNLGPVAPTMSQTVTFSGSSPVLTWSGASGIDYLLMIRVNANNDSDRAFASDWMYGFETTCTDTTAVPGQTYHYYLWCNVGGEWSLTSDVV